VAVLISVVVDASLRDEEYECPLFVNADLACPRAISLMGSLSQSSLLASQPKTHSVTQFSTISAVNTAPAILKVPIPTIEDLEDCKSFGVVLHSCPPWLLPA
jgi:hypothetical protein